MFTVKIEAKVGARHPTASSAAQKLFSWDAAICQPFVSKGILRFRVNPAMVLPVDVLIPRANAEAIVAFLGTFHVLAASSDVTGYYNDIAKVLADNGVANANTVPDAAWPLIVAGLQKYGIALSVYLSALPVEEKATIPISPMHLWAMAEAARGYILYLDPSGVFPTARAAAETVLAMSEGENLSLHSAASPYTSIYLD